MDNHPASWVVAPFVVVLSDDTVLQPDVLVARASDFTERELPTAPLLAVEVLSPSTCRVDLMLKRSRYEAAGCPSYWVVDPDDPALTVWELHDGEYVQQAHVTGTHVYDASTPYTLTVQPRELLR